MARTTGVLGALGLGAGVMYLFDPDRGKRRRAKIRDKAIHYYKTTNVGASKAVKDISNRAKGVVARTEHAFQKQDLSDDVLVERIRARMGRIVSHPSAVEVHCVNGRVTLSGPILADEVNGLVSFVSRMRGVTEVENHLEPHAESDNISALQGEALPKGGQFELSQANWSPAARVIVGATGGGLLAYCLRRGGFIGNVCGWLGFGMIVRSATNRQISRLFEAGAREGLLQSHRTINIKAPVHEVFEFHTNYDNLPRFISGVTEVKDLGEGRSHWTGVGPSGIPVSWDVQTTRFEPDRLVAWNTVPGSPMDVSGSIRFTPNPDGSTRVDLMIGVIPPTAEADKAMFRKMDPRLKMKENLENMKRLIEASRVPEMTGAGAA